MSQSLTLSAGTLMLAVPSLITLGGAVVGVALHGHLTTAIEVARLNATTDERTARWLWQRGYRRTPHAGPDITGVPAIEAEPHVDGEVLHVEHPTGEHRLPSVAEGLARLADEVGLVQALSDEPHHDDDDAPAEDTDRPGLLLVLLAIPVALWDRLCGWLRSFGQSRRERHMIGSGEQATADDPFAELLAHVEAEGREVEFEAWRSAEVERQIVAAMYEPEPPSYKPWHLHDVTAQYEQVRPGRHRAEVVIPAQRDGGE